MPIYDKPMIYYPISTLISAGIREILIISTPYDLPRFQNLLGDGSEFGCVFEYKEQVEANGLAQAFIIGEEFIGKEKVCLILGDNIFYGANLENILKASIDPAWGVVFAYHVNDPERYGLVEFDADKKALSIEEKPTHPKSSYAVPGIYFFDNSVIEVARNIKPSARGEYEITDVNKYYLENGKLQVQIMDRGTAWLDTGTFDSMMQASQFIQVIEERQWLKIGCIEEIAFQKGFLSREGLKSRAQKQLKSWYGQYLLNLLK